MSPSGPSDTAVSAGTPAWAEWRSAASYTLGVEEELMLIDPSDGSLFQSADAVLAGVSDALQGAAVTETHAAVLELRTNVHQNVGGAGAELASLRRLLARDLRTIGGVAAASAGMHPLALSEETQISHGERYRLVEDSMRCLAHREPTMALHVHVGVPDPDDAVRVLNGLGARVAALTAIAANSPFLNGRDSGFCSTRTAIFGSFPRTGTPRPFRSYADYVEAVDVLIASGAISDPTFLWWDVRLQPALGTVELRAVDAQISVRDVIPLIALIQSVARLELEGGELADPPTPEVLEENRFIAARDGLEARLIDPSTRRLVPARTIVQELYERCRPHARALGCSGELERVQRLAVANGADRQRAWAGSGGIASVVPKLIDRF
jgi:glutamate---cysteine ligase / carboxylate-amine ligase